MDIAVVVIPKFEYFDGFIAESIVIGLSQNVVTSLGQCVCVCVCVGKM